jgi:protein-L-isoaspartate O-methyltransferase
VPAGKGVTTSLKVFLRRWPWLDGRLKRLYYAVRELGERYLVGTRLQEWIWKRRTRASNQDAEAEYASSLGHPHRQALLKVIGEYGPLNSVLEVGCGPGPNVHLLSRMLAPARIYGIDVNAQAVAEGQARFKVLGIENCELECRNFKALRQYPDQGMDVVFTDAVLMYVGPDRIRETLGEILRIAGKAAIFSEWHQSLETRNGARRPAARYLYGHWIYDYADLLSEFLGPGSVTLTRYGEGMWADANWKAFGWVIVAEQQASMGSAKNG